MAAALALLVLAAGMTELTPDVALSETASQPGSAFAGRIDAGGTHSCAILSDDTVRRWGGGGAGQLGYGNTTPIGDNEAPDSVGPVNLGVGWRWL